VNGWQSVDVSKKLIAVVGGGGMVLSLGSGLAIKVARSEQALSPPTFTSAQAQRGQETYIAQCAQCHGDNLDNGQFAVPLKGPAFRQHWGGKGLDGPFEFMAQNMPPTNPGDLSAATYADVLAFILSKNGVAPGTMELPADSEALKGMAAPQ
jgi:S-disulfanyl-L-cysteine oxidoreductase SoxD